MGRPEQSERRLPESLTRHLKRSRDAIWPTPDDRHRHRTGAHRPRIPSAVFKGLWMWALAYNLIGAVILAVLWASMGR